MYSDIVKKGVEKTPHRSLFKASGLTDEELSRPLIGVVSSKNEIIPGHVMLDKIAEAVKAGVRIAGGTPLEFPAIGVCDGIAMGHVGMKYSPIYSPLYPLAASSSLNIAKLCSTTASPCHGFVTLIMVFLSSSSAITNPEAWFG